MLHQKELKNKNQQTNTISETQMKIIQIKCITITKCTHWTHFHSDLLWLLHLRVKKPVRDALFMLLYISAYWEKNISAYCMNWIAAETSARLSVKLISVELVLRYVPYLRANFSNICFIKEPTDGVELRRSTKIQL